MSEVLHADATTSTENAGISRRRVGTAVAWSLPVILTAVAAPAAAASGLSATAGLVGGGSAVTYVSAKGTGTGTNRTGTGPTALQIQNAGSAINGTISGTINITPIGTVQAGIGVQSISSVGPAAPSYSLDHTYNASFTFTAAVGSGQSVNYPIQFHYESVSPMPAKGVVHSYHMTMTVTLPDRTTQALTTQLAITF